MVRNNLDKLLSYSYFKCDDFQRCEVRCLVHSPFLELVQGLETLQCAYAGDDIRIGNIRL